MSGSGRPSLHHSLTTKLHPSISIQTNDRVSITKAPTDTDTPPSPSSEPPPFDIYTEDLGDPRGASRVAGEQAVNVKVAIPRLDLPVAAPNGRVSRACHNCRKQKNKCSGHRPSCLRCQETNVPCVYVDGKRERNARHLTVVTSQLEHYENLVRDIYPKFDLEVARFVDQALGKISSLSLSSPTVAQAPDDVNTPNTPRAASGLDHTLENFNGDSSLQAMGFVGEHSARVWLYRLRRHIAWANPNVDNQSDQSNPPSLASCDFFLDEAPIPLSAELEFSVYPSQNIADELVDRYFQVAHASFPFIGKEIFLSQCRSFYSNAAIQPGNKWMALLNMVFAIAAKHSEFTGGHQRLDHKSHAVYFSRAWNLNMNEKVMLDHPNLQQAQIEGLISLYLLSIGQANRAWRMCGIAIQSAISMGIHLRSDSMSITHVSKETRYRLWWALYVLDTLICVMTGRMPRMQQEHCTTPMPVPFEEEVFWSEPAMAVILDNQARISLVGSLLGYNSPSEADQTPKPSATPHHQASPGQLKANGSLYFLYAIELVAVMREAIDMFYSPGSAKRSRTETEQAMRSLNTTADNWFSRLPTAYHFINLEADDAFARQRTSLAFQYYSTKLLISHPALCFHSRDEAPFHAVHQQMGTVCFNAAAQIVDLLPNEFDNTWLSNNSPWWCTLHYLTQGVVVLVTQLLIENEKPSTQSTSLLQRIQKALQWITELSQSDPAFERPRDILTGLLSSQGFNIDLR